MKLHQEDKTYYCGNAVTQMILAELGVAELPSQFDLDHQLQDGSLGTKPTSLAAILSAMTPGPTAFSVYTDHDVNATFARIIAATNGGMPVAAQVLGGRHWVAIGQAADAASQGFFYNDPYPQTASQADSTLSTSTKLAPPHDADDVCGIGDGNVDDRAWFGYADAFLSLAEWPDYMSAPADPAQSAGSSATYVTVAPSGLEPEYSTDTNSTEVSVEREQARILLTEMPEAAALSGARGLVDEPTAMASAARGIVDRGLDRRGPLREFLAGAEPAGAQLVRYRGGAAYYLVRLERERKPVGLARIRARDGEFLGVVAASTVHELPPYDHARVHRALAESAYSLYDVVTRAQIATGEFTLAPALVWKPCRESMSPYFPFVQIDIADTALYLAWSGRIHRQLNDDIHA